MRLWKSPGKGIPGYDTPPVPVDEAGRGSKSSTVSSRIRGARKEMTRQEKVMSDSSKRTFWGGGRWPVLLVIAAACLLCLAGISHRRSRQKDLMAGKEGADRLICLYGNDDPHDLEILRSRLDLFAGRGKYSLGEDQGRLLLRLPGRDAFSRVSLERELEYFLTEPGPLMIARRAPGDKNSSFLYTVLSLEPAMIAQTGIEEKTSEKTGLPQPGDEQAAQSAVSQADVGSTDRQTGNIPVLEVDEGEPEERRISIQFTDEAAKAIRDRCEEGTELALINNEVYAGYDTNELFYEGWIICPDPQDDRTYYIDYSASDVLFGKEKLLFYNLTHETLSRPFSYVISGVPVWDDPEQEAAAGMYQCGEADIAGSWHEFQIFSSEKTTADERAEFIRILTRRLDLLERPYAVGHMQDGDVCIRIQADQADPRVNSHVISILCRMSRYNSFCLYVPRVNYNFSPNYMNIRFVPSETEESGVLALELSEEDNRRLQSALAASAKRADFLTVPETAENGQPSEGAVRDNVYYISCGRMIASGRIQPSPTDSSVKLTRIAGFMAEQPDTADLSWYAALMRDIIDTGDTDIPGFRCRAHWFHTAEGIYTILPADDALAPQNEQFPVNTQEIADAVHKIVPGASVHLSSDGRSLQVRLYLPLNDDFADRIFSLTPEVLRAIADTGYCFSEIRLYPCENLGDERSWLVFGRKSMAEAGDDDTGSQFRFRGLLFNGRMDAYAGRIEERMKTDTFFTDMTDTSTEDGWELRSF